MQRNCSGIGIMTFKQVGGKHFCIFQAITQIIAKKIYSVVTGGVFFIRFINHMGYADARLVPSGNLSATFLLF